MIKSRGNHFKEMRRVCKEDIHIKESSQGIWIKKKRNIIYSKFNYSDDTHFSTGVSI